jgi:malonyl-CoA/methylmalonyl-CoA synthetase
MSAPAPDLLATIVRRAARGIDAPFLSGPGQKHLTYATLLPEIARFASALRAFGVAKGDRVTVQVEKSPEALLIYLACLAEGAIFMPLNTGYTQAEVDYFVADAEPRLFVADPQAFEPVRPGMAFATLAADGSGRFADAVPASADWRPVDSGPGDLAAMCYTSGTTGRPKGAMISRGALAANAATLAEAWRFTSDDVLLHILPVYHVHGLFVATNTVIAAGASMRFLPRFDVDEVLAELPHATALMGVPTHYTRLLNAPEALRKASRAMRLFVSGSAPLLAETHKAFEAATGHVILERYGMTETLMNTSNPYDGPRVAGTVGPPLPGVELRIVEPEAGHAVQPGEVGMIEVRGPNLFKGYWRNPGKTAEDMRPDGFFITGDLGLIDANGYVQIVGRGKDLIITGGLNVYPKEVEAEVNALPGVAESAVIGVPHPDFGEGVVAIAIAEAGKAPDEAAMLEALAGRLAKFKLPKRIVMVDALPRNAMGKVQKNLLRDRFAGLFVG